MKKNLLFVTAIMLLFAFRGYSQAYFKTGAMFVNVDKYGGISLSSDDVDTTTQLYRAAILVKSSPTAVFDYWNDVYYIDPTTLVASPASSDFEIIGTYDNSYPAPDPLYPPAVTVKINAYGWNSAAYTLVKFKITNNETSAIDASAGLDILSYLHMDWGYDTISYNSGESVIRFHKGTGVNMGIKLLSATLTSLYSFEWYDGYQVDADFGTWMDKGSLQPSYKSTTTDGPVTITSQAPVSLAPGASFDVYYALALGDDEQAMLANILAAKLKYETLITSVKDRQPSVNGLKNYPNPVMSATKISFDLPKSGFVSLKIYDVVGHEIATLVSSNLSAGSHTIDFNAKNLRGGVYSYKLSCNNKVTTNKMMIVK